MNVFYADLVGSNRCRNVYLVNPLCALKIIAPGCLRPGPGNSTAPARYVITEVSTAISPEGIRLHLLFPIHVNI